MKTRDILKWVKGTHGYLKKPLILLVLFSIITSITAIAFAFLTKQTLDGMVEGNQDKFVLSAAFLVAVLLIQIITKTVKRYLSTYYLTVSDNTIKRSLYNGFLTTKHETLSQTHTGTMMNAIESDARTVSEGLVNLIPQAVFLALRFVLAFALLFYLDVLFASLMALIGLIFLVGSVIVRNTVRKRHNALKDAESKRRGFIQETLSNAMLIKAFQAKAHSDKTLKEYQSNYLHAMMRKTRVMILASSALNIFFAGGYAFAIIYGAIKMQEGLLMVGSLVAIVQLIQYMQSPFSGLSSLVPQYYGALASAERLMKFENFEKEEVHQYVKTDNFKAFKLENVDFSYGDGAILSGVTLRVHRGEFIHIKGDSGIGKTTLFKLLLGLLTPQGGGIYIYTADDDAIPISSKTRSYFTYVPQGHMILSGTIFENIIYNAKDVTMEMVRKAASVAELDEEIERLEKGYHTRLNEKGLGLSEGQLQRLALARALVRDAPVLLLDEVTSALDKKTEQKVLTNIKALTDKTCLFISHRSIPTSLVNHTFDFS
jgi:ATP-binding cassette subfamily B protein